MTLVSETIPKGSIREEWEEKHMATEVGHQQ